MRYFLAIMIIFIFPVSSFGQDTSGHQKLMGLTLSLPWINTYTYYNHELKNTNSKSGFLGLGAGVFCKLNKNKSSINFGLTADLPSHGREARTFISSIYVEGLYHKNISKRFNVIGGINFINYRFGVISYLDNLQEYIRNDRTVGLTTGIEYLCFDKFALALFYRPTAFSFDVKQYKHLISLDFRCDIFFRGNKNSRKKMQLSK